MEGDTSVSPAEPDAGDMPILCGSVHRIRNLRESTLLSDIQVPCDDEKNRGTAKSNTAMSTLHRPFRT